MAKRGWKTGNKKVDVVEKISEEWFSKKYKKLPFYKKILLKRKINKRIAEMHTRIEKTKKGVIEFNERTAGIAMDLTSHKLVKVSLREKKQEMYNFSKEKKLLAEEIKKFKKFVSPYFWGFEPIGLIAKPSSNYLEITMHQMLRSMDLINTQLESISKNLEFIEKKMIKKRL